MPIPYQFETEPNRDWDFVMTYRYLFMDVAGIDINTKTGSAKAVIPGGAAAAKEQSKFMLFPKLVSTISAFRFVPFVFETYGRLGLHAEALLKEWADRIGKYSLRIKWKKKCPN